MIYRDSVNGDIPELIELSRLFDTSPYSFDKHLTSITDTTYPAFAYDMLLSPTSSSFVAEENNEVIGFITYCMNLPLSIAAGKKTGSILLLAVHPSHRGQGIGRHLVTIALERLCGINAEIITVGTDLYNYPAIQIYESSGFRFRMGWHIFRYYQGNGRAGTLSEHIAPPDGPEIEIFLQNLSRPVSLLKERNSDRGGLLEYLIDNARRSLYKGKSKCFIYWQGKDPAGFINIINDDICRKTLMTDKTAYKILDVIVLNKYKEKGIEAEMLNDIKTRLNDYCLLDLWLDAENAGLIEAAEDAGFHLSYSGAAFHYYCGATQSI